MDGNQRWMRFRCPVCGVDVPGLALCNANELVGPKNDRPFILDVCGHTATLREMSYAVEEAPDAN